MFAALFDAEQKPSPRGRGTAASAVVDEGRFLCFETFHLMLLRFYPHQSRIRDS